MLVDYTFWLAVVSAGCLVAERIAPWRRGQRFLRPGLAQDGFWLVFNGCIVTIAFGGVLRFTETALGVGFSRVFGVMPGNLRAIAGFSLPVQVIVVLVVSDLVEWLVHNALHRWRPLWGIHRLHHSIRIMDWIGNFRFHWGEIIVYKTVKYLPLAVLGARWESILVSAVIATLIGNLNHSNLNISWGPFRYVLNSPRMHIWHHDKNPASRAGVNFGVVFSLWDWIFGTAYMPREAKQPAELGFRGMEKSPTSLGMRFFLP
ncbi:MAG: sterol desaturase family protein, partial [Lentisphaerae bacterium]|nr:sterol desaturase family protein [Lentisphaerota bacterium]